MDTLYTRCTFCPKFMCFQISYKYRKQSNHHYLINVILSAMCENIEQKDSLEKTIVLFTFIFPGREIKKILVFYFILLGILWYFSRIPTFIMLFLCP